MVDTITISQAEKDFRKLTDEAHAGHTFILSQQGQKRAVLIGIDEYDRLMEVERLQREQDFAILSSPPDSNEMSEEEAIALAVRAVREVREELYRTNSL